MLLKAVVLKHGRGRGRGESEELVGWSPELTSFPWGRRDPGLPQRLTVNPLSRGAQWCGCPAHGRNRAGDAEHILMAWQRIGECSYSRQWRIRQNTGVYGTPRGLSPYTFLKEMNEKTLHLKLSFQKNNWQRTPERQTVRVHLGRHWSHAATLTLLLSLPLLWGPNLKTSRILRVRLSSSRLTAWPFPPYPSFHSKSKSPIFETMTQIHSISSD